MPRLTDTPSLGSKALGLYPVKKPELSHIYTYVLQGFIAHAQYIRIIISKKDNLRYET